MLPRNLYYKGVNEWAKSDEPFQIRFEEYQGFFSGYEYKNAIRIKFVSDNPDSKKYTYRVLWHKGSTSNSSNGCDVPTCDITKYSKGTFGNLRIDALKSQDVLGIRGLFDKYIPSDEKIDKRDRKVQTPKKGYDFLMVPNSEARYPYPDLKPLKTYKASVLELNREN